MFASPPLFRVVESRLLRRFDVVFVHGERSKEELEETEPGVPREIIPHGDERLFTDGPPPPPAEEERILFFGDWRKVKGLPALMEAFDELVRRRPSARLTIAGRPAPQTSTPRSCTAGRTGMGTGSRSSTGMCRSRRSAISSLRPGRRDALRRRISKRRRAPGDDDGPSAGRDRYRRPRLVGDRRRDRAACPAQRQDALVAALEQVIADRGPGDRFGAEGRRRVLDRSGWETVAKLVETALGSLNGSRRR